MSHTDVPSARPRERRSASIPPAGAATTTARTRQDRRFLAILVLVFVCLAAGIIAVGYLSYRSYAAQYRTQVESALSAIAELKVAELVQWRNERLSDAGVLFENDAFSGLVSRLFADPKDADAQRQIAVWMAQYRAHLQYDQVRLMAPQAATRVSNPPNLPPVSIAVRDRVAHVVQSRRVALTDLYRNEHDGRVYITTLIPILDTRDRRRVIAVLGLRVDPARYLFPFIQRWPTTSQTAETLLVRRDGNDVLFLNELRFQKQTALALRIPLSRTQTLAARAALGRTGIIEGVDYRGIPAIGDVRPIPGSPWFLVARMNASEVTAPVRARMWEMLLLVGALILASGSGVGAVWRQQRARAFRERYEAAEVLRASEVRYRLLFQNLSAGFALHEIILEDDGTPSDYRFLEVNPAFEALTTLSASELVGRRVRDVMPGIEPEWIATYGRVATTGEPVSFENYTEQLGRYYQVTAYSPEPGRFATIFQDITARKQTQIALRESADRLRRAEAMGHLGHWSLDLRTQRVSWSDEVFRIHGAAVAEGDVATDAVMAFVHPDDRGHHVQAVSAIRHDGHGTFEYRIVRPDGATRHVSAYGELASDAAGAPASIFGTLQDVTDLRQKERELQERNDELARFTYTVSHDLKSPLVTITTFLGFLEQDARQQDAARMEKDVAYIRGAASKMAQLLDELLELSRVGRKMNPFVETPLRALVQDAQSLVAGRIAARGVQVRVTGEPVLLYGDRPRLVEVFQNLLDNAVKFMGDQIAPCVEVGLQAQGADTVVFVRDNGIGIDPRHQHKLFGLFEKLDATVEGTGMGLALVRRIVDVHGGRIWVESEGVGKGTTFCFTLAKTRRLLREEQSP